MCGASSPRSARILASLTYAIGLTTRHYFAAKPRGTGCHLTYCAAIVVMAAARTQDLADVTPITPRLLRTHLLQCFQLGRQQLHPVQPRHLQRETLARNRSFPQ